MPRMGTFFHKYDPDEATPLPRPFILEGENERGVKPVSLKPKAPPKNPDTYLPTTPDGLYSTAWFAEFAKVEAGASRKTVERYLTKKQAIAYGAGKKAGLYVRWVTGYDYDPLTGNMSIPKHAYYRVPDNIMQQWGHGDPSWNTDPRRAMALAKFFWKYGYRSDYYALKKWMKQRAHEIRSDQQTAFNMWRNEQVQNYQDYMSKWGGNFGS